MTARLTPETARAFDSLNAIVSRLRASLGGAFTTTEALARAEADLVQMIPDAKALRLMVRQEIAAAKTRERDDRSIRKAAAQ